MNKQTALYLKQFFNNFTIRQKHVDMVNLVNSSLEVLEEFVNQFMSKHTIPVPRNIQYQIQDESFNAIFQRVYTRLNTVFEWAEHIQCGIIPQSRTSPADDILETTSTKSKDLWGQGSDEELYQILSQYKSANKKLKENVQSLTQKLNSKNNESLQFKVAKQIAQKEQIYLNSRIEQLENQNRMVKLQISFKSEEVMRCEKQMKTISKQLSEKINQLDFLSNKLSLKESELKQCQQNYHKINEQKIKADRKLTKFLDQQTCLIKQKLAQLPQIIDQKIKNEKTYAKPTVQVLKRFIKFSIVNKQYDKSNNFSPTQNSGPKIESVS